MLTRTQSLAMLAALAAVNEKTVRRWLRGEPLKDATRERIELAVKEHVELQPLAEARAQG